MKAKQSLPDQVTNRVPLPNLHNNHANKGQGKGSYDSSTVSLMNELTENSPRGSLMNKGAHRGPGKNRLDNARFQLNMPEVKLVQDHAITAKEGDNGDYSKEFPESNRTTIGAQHQRKYARNNLAQSLHLQPGRFKLDKIGGGQLRGDWSQQSPANSGMPPIVNRNFDARNKHGREIVEHYQQVSKDGLDKFLRAAKNRDILYSQNRPGLNDFTSPKHLLASQALRTKGRASVTDSFKNQMVEAGQHRSQSVFGMLQKKEEKSQMSYIKSMYGYDGTSFTAESSFQQRAGSTKKFQHKMPKSYAAKSVDRQRFILHEPDKIQSIQQRVDHYLKLMEGEDEETILDQDSNNLIRKLKQKEKMSKQQEKGPDPETPKSISKLNRSQLGKLPEQRLQASPFLPSYMQKKQNASIRKSALHGVQCLKKAVIRDKVGQYIQDVHKDPTCKHERHHKKEAQPQSTELHDQREHSPPHPPPQNAPPQPPKEEHRPSILKDIKSNIPDKSAVRSKPDDGIRDQQLYTSRLSIPRNIPFPVFEKFILNSAKSDCFVDMFRQLQAESQERDNKKAKQDAPKPKTEAQQAGGQGARKSTTEQRQPKDQTAETQADNQPGTSAQGAAAGNNPQSGHQQHNAGKIQLPSVYRVSRQVLLKHIRKRYKNLIHERKLAKFLDDHINRGYDYREYIEMLYKLLITPIMNLTKEKTSAKGDVPVEAENHLPNLFKFCFEVFSQDEKEDRKEYICEHDLFVLLQLISRTNDGKVEKHLSYDAPQLDPAEQADHLEQKRLEEMPVDYCTNHQPLIGSSLFVDAFAYDISLLFQQMKARIPRVVWSQVSPRMKEPRENEKDPQKNESQADLNKKGNEAQEQQAFDDGDSKGKGQTNKQLTEMEMIFQQIEEHMKSNLELAQSEGDPDSMKYEHKHMLTKKDGKPVELFNHQNPFLKQLTNKKLSNKFIFTIIDEHDHTHYCRQIRFRQFANTEFFQLVPQFIIDFFHHMTGLDLLDLMDQRKVYRLQGNEKCINPDLDTKGSKSPFNSQTESNMAGGVQIAKQFIPTHQAPRRPSANQHLAGQAQKSLRHLKNVPLSQFALADLQFLRRELQKENVKQLYLCIDPSPSQGKKVDDETRLYDSVRQAFRSISNNGHVANEKQPGYVHELDVYLTFESLKAHLPRVIGHCNDSFALRFYNVLSMGKMMKRIYLPQFMIMVHPLLFGNWIEKNYFAFRMLDGDDDGVISAVDLSDLIKNVLEKCPSTGYGDHQTKLCTCVMYQEVMGLYEMNLSENIKVENQKLRKHIDFATFLQETGITMSVLAIQIQNILLHKYMIETEKESTKIARAERMRRTLLQTSQQIKPNLRPYPTDLGDSDSQGSQKQNKRSKLKDSKRDENGDGSDGNSDNSRPSSPVSNLQCQQYSVFDHSSEERIKQLKAWMKQEASLQWQPRHIDEYDNAEHFNSESTKKPPASIKIQANRRRLFILRNGLIPGQPVPSAAAQQERERSQPISNIRNYAQNIHKTVKKTFNEQMNVEEELRNGRPTSASSPLFRERGKQHLGQSEQVETNYDAFEEGEAQELLGLN